MALRRTFGPLALSALVIALLSPFSPVKVQSAGAEEGVSAAGCQEPRLVRSSA